MYTAANRMNLTKSIGNPKSRFERIRYYLFVNGPRTKREILRDVFGKEVYTDRNSYRPDRVSMGWASYVFNLAVKNHLFHKTRKGNVTYWSI
jgi:hypothetical protein